jgi:hypothetical protein
MESEDDHHGESHCARASRESEKQVVDLANASYHGIRRVQIFFRNVGLTRAENRCGA